MISNSPYGSPMILVFADIRFIPKFEGVSPSEGVDLNDGGVSIRIGDFRPYLRNGARHGKGYY